MAGTLMRRQLARFAAVATVAWLSMTAPALALCAGNNILDDWRAKDPEGVAAVFARAHSLPNAQGRYWQIDKPGIQPSVLLGTFHSAGAVKTIPTEIWGTLENARVAVFEIDLEQQAAMAQRMASDPTFAFDYGRPPLSSILTEDQYANLGIALAERGLPIETAEQMRPWLLASMLGFPACHVRGLARGEQPLDVVMAERAEAKNIPVVGLETYEQSIAAFQRIDPDVLMQTITGVSLTAGIEEDLFRTNTDLYTAGEAAVINEFAIWLSDKLEPGVDNRALNDLVMKEILDVRNLAWMDALEGQLAGGNAFVAVGALHLPGKLGLIELLRERGYTVTRLD
jgi:uncharacterized protein YbaP (TraB family)